MGWIVPDIIEVRSFVDRMVWRWKILTLVVWENHYSPNIMRVWLVVIRLTTLICCLHALSGELALFLPISDLKVIWWVLGRELDED